MEQYLLELLIFMVAAMIAVPLAKYCKLGSVLGYLIAGIVIGPFGLSLISDIEGIMHITEFGVVMMLFLVGLELKPALLWRLRVPILGMGGSQVMLTALAIGLLAAIALPWRQAAAAGLILALSSTAIVLQTLREQGQMNTPSGRSIFSILLFQDLAVIPILALLPLLAVEATAAGTRPLDGVFDISSLPGALRLLVVLAVITLIYLLGRYGSRPVFRIIAATRVREVFVAAALALVIGISLLMHLVGLSPALGTFIAGVVLADSEYRHELESDIEPFKGLLLGIFFISIGASLNVTLITANTALVGGLVLALLTVKFSVLLAIARLFRTPGNDPWLIALALAQGGEFAFVLFQFAKTNGILSPENTALLVSVVAISMFLAPPLFLLYEKVIIPRRGQQPQAAEADSIEARGRSVILAGFGRMGTDLGRLLIAAGIKPTILDHNEANVEVLRRFGFEVYYGDATRLDLLQAAGAAEAELIVITLGEHEQMLTMVKLIRKHYPQLKIAVNAVDRAAAYDFMELGVEAIRRETFGSALNLGWDALALLGFPPYESYRLMRLFRKHDENTLPELFRISREDRSSYVSMYQQHNNDLARLLQKARMVNFEELDRAWTTIRPLDITEEGEDPPPEQDRLLRQ